MPTLFKRSNGIYYISFEEGGKRKWKSTGERQKPAALRVLLNFELRLLHIQSSDNFRTKAGRRRAVPMSEPVLQILWSKTRRSLSENVFTLNGSTISEDWLTHRFKSYIRKAGLNPRLHFHSLRHTFATWLVQEGVSIYEVQKLLGHSSISATQIYSHLAASELHGAVNKIQIVMN